MSQLTVDLQSRILNGLGYDSDKMLEIYHAFNRSTFAFERHFIVEELFEFELMNEIKGQFTLYNTVVNEIKARGR